MAENRRGPSNRLNSDDAYFQGEEYVRPPDEQKFENLLGGPT
jgi:hypothetical protein